MPALWRNKEYNYIITVIRYFVVVWCGTQSCDARMDTRRISISQVSLPVHFTGFFL